MFERGGEFHRVEGGIRDPVEALQGNGSFKFWVATPPKGLEDRSPDLVHFCFRLYEVVAPSFVTALNGCFKPPANVWRPLAFLACHVEYRLRLAFAFDHQSGVKRRQR